MLGTTVSIAVACTISVTGITTGCKLLPPDGVIVTDPLYVPVAKLFAKIDTVTVPGVVPLDGVADSHEPPDVVFTLVVNVTAGPLLTDTLNICDEGSDPMVTMLNVSEFGDTCNAGVEEMVKATGTLKGAPPAGVMVMAPV